MAAYSLVLRASRNHNPLLRLPVDAGRRGSQRFLFGLFAISRKAHSLKVKYFWNGKKTWSARVVRTRLLPLLIIGQHFGFSSSWVLFSPSEVRPIPDRTLQNRYFPVTFQVWLFTRQCPVYSPGLRKHADCHPPNQSPTAHTRRISST